MLTPSRRALLQGALASLAAGPLTGCGRRTVQHEGGRVVVSFWISYGDKVRKVLLELVERFNRSQSKVLVKATYQGDYFECLAKLRTAIVAKAAPTFSHVVGEVVPYLARAEVLETLDDARYEGASTLPLLRPLAQAGAYVGGDQRPLVAIPFNRSTPIMFVNADVLAAEGVEVPRTWDELREASRRLTKDGGRTRWGYEVPVDWWFWVALVGQAGGSVVDDHGVPTLGGDAGERALAFWQTLIHDDKVMRPPQGRDYDAWQATNQDFLSGGAAMTWTSTAFLNYLQENAKFKVLAAPLPEGVRRSVPTGGTFFVVLRSAPDEEKLAAWSFLRWMCEAEQTIEWATRTGYLPVTGPAIARLEETGYYDSHPNHRVAYEQLANVDAWPWAPNLFRIQRDIVQPRLERAILGKLDPHAVLEEAREDALRAV